MILGRNIKCDAAVMVHRRDECTTGVAGAEVLGTVGLHVAVDREPGLEAVLLAVGTGVICRLLKSAIIQPMVVAKPVNEVVTRPLQFFDPDTANTAESSFEDSVLEIVRVNDDHRMAIREHCVEPLILFDRPAGSHVVHHQVARLDHG